MKKLCVIFLIIVGIVFGSLYLGNFFYSGDNYIDPNPDNYTYIDTDIIRYSSELSLDLIMKNNMARISILWEMLIILDYQFELPKSEGYYIIQSKMEKTDRYVTDIIEYLQRIGVFNSSQKEQNYETLLSIMRQREDFYEHFFNNINELEENKNIDLKDEESKKMIKDMIGFLLNMEDSYKKIWEDIKEKL